MNLKDEILGVAKGLFIKNGYNCHYYWKLLNYQKGSKGSLYYHFKTRENLLLEILNIEKIIGKN